MTDNQKAVLAEHQAADAEERKTLGSLLGHTIMEAEFGKTGYGSYTFTLDDGRIVAFRDSPYLEMTVTAL
jgi:hypothetical protein